MQLSAFSRSWRWVALLLVVINALHGLLLQRLHPSLPSIAEISAKNQNLFAPADYAFAIWGVIYTAFVIFCVYTLLPSQRNSSEYEPLSRALVVYALLGIAWEETFIRQYLGLSVVIIIAMFVAGAVMFGLAKKRLWSGLGRAPLYSPFSLFFGWISVASLADTVAWLKSMGWEGGRWGEVPWTIAMIAATLCLGILISRRWRDSIYPLVILWSLVAIWERHRTTSGPLEYAALIASMLMALWTLINAGWIRSRVWLLKTQATRLSPV